MYWKHYDERRCIIDSINSNPENITRVFHVFTRRAIFIFDRERVLSTISNSNQYRIYSTKRDILTFIKDNSTIWLDQIFNK